MNGPLAGITVLDLGRVISGPMCALTLAELGATVIRIERPGGDFSWNLPPFLHPDATVGPERRGRDDIALSHAKRDHGKRSVELDYTTPEGRASLLRLVRSADVVVENFRPGVMAALGLDYGVLRAANERIVHCSITGYGHDGPYRDRHGMALLVAAMSGAIAKTGFPDGPPVTPGFPIGDHAAAVYAVVGILAALRQRERTGTGQFVDVSMFDVMTRLMWDEPLDQYRDEGRSERNGNTDPRSAPINVYPTADGWVALLASKQAHFDRLCARMGRPDLAAGHPDLAARAAAATEIDAAVAEWCSRLPSAEVVRALDEIDVPNAPVRAPWGTCDDPHTEARQMLISPEHAAAPGVPAPYRTARIPIRMSDAELGASPVVEPLGASTREILES